MVTFTVDGRPCEGREGEPLAVSLLAAGRPILSRSFRFHRPRGLMCSTGQCGWCECEVDGRPSVRSCREPVRAGLVARGEHAVPSIERDALSLVGLVSRWIPPTFYHHRFLRPRALRKRYLDVLRWFGGRGRLAPGERRPPTQRTIRETRPDVLVVGGGRAGLLAALGAAEAGGHVVLVEAERSLDHRWRGPAGVESGLRSIAELEDLARAAGVEVLTGVVAVGWYDGMVAAIGETTRHEFRARSIVAATGSYDRVPLVPGNDRPGVMAARTAGELVDRHGVLPGERALLVGDGAELVAAGERLEAGGADLVGRVATTSVRRILGGRRVSGVIHADGGRDRRERVDLVVFGDRSPNLDLVLAAGAIVVQRGADLIPACDGSGATSVPGMFVAGSAGGRPIRSAADAETAHLTGRAAGSPTAVEAADVFDKRTGVSGRSQRDSDPTTARPELAADAVVCFCEDVRVREMQDERRAGYGDPELLKRRTGALTGPCQGKYCLQAFACVALAGTDSPVGLPTARPPLRPVRLGDLAGTIDPSRAGDPDR